ncbi:MAG: ABC transporter ATP-binding protein [Herpetosiphonaceae bacterium]|nr:ABC transporter ATP-binding protein [Herpetosiphonaceae bacterium]
MPAKQYLLRVKGLKTYFHSEEGTIKAVDGVDFTVQAGEVLGIVGESGCGKSVTALSIMRLISSPGEIAGGEVIFDGDDLLELPAEQMRKLRGNHIAMIFQQPTTSLNPVFRIGDQIAEVLKVHKQLNDTEAKARTEELLTMVGFPDPRRRMGNYPHQLSGGMCQRVMIAMGLACDPELLIADEPTTALDVTIQAQILDLMRNLKEQINTAIILITHDLGVVAEMVDNVLVMYAGKVVEYAPVNGIFDAPKHPYTQGLLASIPVQGVVKEELDAIPGSVPSLLDLPPGCRFAPRCPYRMAKCDQEEPPLIKLEGNRLVRCWLY